MCFRKLNRSVNQHSFKSLFSSLLSMKRDLILQDRRLILPELRYLRSLSAWSSHSAGVSGFHTLALVHDLAVAVGFPVNKADLFAKRFKTAVGHNQNVHRHVNITH